MIVSNNASGITLTIPHSITESVISVMCISGPITYITKPTDVIINTSTVLKFGDIIVINIYNSIRYIRAINN